MECLVGLASNGGFSCMEYALVVGPYDRTTPNLMTLDPTTPDHKIILPFDHTIPVQSLIYTAYNIFFHHRWFSEHTRHQYVSKFSLSRRIPCIRTELRAMQEIRKPVVVNKTGPPYPLNANKIDEYSIYCISRNMHFFA